MNLNQKIKKMAKIIFGVILFLFLLYLFTPKILGLFYKDILPVYDSDLTLQKISIPENENAFYDLIKIKNIYTSNEINDYLSGAKWDENKIQEILLKNEENLKYFSDAAKKPKFQDPATDSPEKFSSNLVIKNLNAIRSMARLSNLEALYLQKQNKNLEAIEKSLESIKIGDKIQNSQGVIVYYLIGIAVKDIGLETLQKLIKESELPSKNLIQYAAELENYKNNKEGLKSVFIGENIERKKVFDTIASGDKEKIKEMFGEEDSMFYSPKLTTNNFYFQPNKTNALFINYTKQQIDNTDKFCGEIKPIEIEQQLPEINSWKSYIKLYFTENAVGKTLHDVIAVSLSNIHKKRCDEDFLLSSTQLMFILKAYKLEKGELPNSLSDLMIKIPKDPFNGKEIKYSKEKRIIYSVGKDLKDEGGSEGENWREMPDPTFKLDFDNLSRTNLCGPQPPIECYPNTRLTCVNGKWKCESY